MGAASFLTVDFKAQWVYNVRKSTYPYKANLLCELSNGFTCNAVFSTLNIKDAAIVRWCEWLEPADINPHNVYGQRLAEAAMAWGEEEVREISSEVWENAILNSHECNALQAQLWAKELHWRSRQAFGALEDFLQLVYDVKATPQSQTKAERTLWELSGELTL